MRRLEALSQNPYQASKMLGGNLHGLRSARVGSIRIIFELLESSSLILVERVDYRGQVYR